MPAVALGSLSLSQVLVAVFYWWRYLITTPLKDENYGVGAFCLAVLLTLIGIVIATLWVRDHVNGEEQ